MRPPDATSRREPPLAEHRSDVTRTFGADGTGTGLSLVYSSRTLVSRGPGAAAIQARLLDYARETLRVHDVLQRGDHFFGSPVYAVSVDEERPSWFPRENQVAGVQGSGATATAYVSFVSGAPGAQGQTISLADWMKANRWTSSPPTGQQLSTVAFQLLAFKLALLKARVVGTSAPNLLTFTPGHLSLRLTRARPTVLEVAVAAGVPATLTNGFSSFKDLRYADQRPEDVAFHWDGLVHFNVPETLSVIPAAGPDDGKSARTVVTVDQYLDRVYPYALAPEAVAEFFDETAPEPGQPDAGDFWAIGHTLVRLGSLHYEPPEYLGSRFPGPQLFPVGVVHEELVPVYRDLYPLFSRVARAQGPVDSYVRVRHNWLLWYVRAEDTVDEILARARKAGQAGVRGRRATGAVNFVALANHLVFGILFARALGDPDTVDPVDALGPSNAATVLRAHSAAIDDFSLGTYYRTPELIREYRAARTSGPPGPPEPTASPSDIPSLFLDRRQALSVVPSFYVPLVEALGFRFGTNGMDILRNLLAPTAALRGRLPFDGTLAGATDRGPATDLALVLGHPYFRVQAISLDKFIAAYVTRLTLGLKPLSRFYGRRYSLEPSVVPEARAPVESVQTFREFTETEVVTRILDRATVLPGLRIPALVFDEPGGPEILRIYDSFSDDG